MPEPCCTPDALEKEYFAAEIRREVPSLRAGLAAEGEGGTPKIGAKLNSNRPKIPDAQDMVVPKRTRGRPPKPRPFGSEGGPKRKRGAQPGNTNAVKTNRHGREAQEGRELRRRVRVFIRGVGDLLARVNAETEAVLAAQREAEREARRRARNLEAPPA